MSRSRLNSRTNASIPRGLRLAIKIGGSILIGAKGPKQGYLKRLIPVINEIKKNSKLLILGIGGGKLVRNYFSSIKHLLNEQEMEWVGIDLLHANARFLAFLFKGIPVPDLNDVKKLNGKNPAAKVLTVSGLKPGRSTDANTALLAEKFGVHAFIILTDVDGIYDRDPKKYKSAKLIEKIKFSELERFAQRDTSPGNYGVVDPLAIKIIARSKIRTHIINGKRPENLLKLLRGEKIGTEICE